MPTPSLYPYLMAAQSGGPSVVVPGVVEAAVAALLSADVSLPTLDAQVNAGLVISVAQSIIDTNVQSALSVTVDSIQVEVDIC